MRQLPPLKALRYFEETARSGSIRAAAEVLRISPSAISLQISKLENHLGLSLFHRRDQRLILTDTGRNYLDQISRAFNRIEEATWDTIDALPHEELTLSLPPSFLVMWLSPRLPEFLAANPHLSIRFVDALTIDESLSRVDCGIEYRHSGSPERYSEHLFDDELVILATPEYLRQNPIHSLADLQGKMLIMTERRHYSWRYLLANLAWFKDSRILSVRYSYQAYHLALENLGLMLGNRHHFSQAIAQGSLVIPFDVPMDSRAFAKYFFSCSEASRKLPKVALFYDWLIQQATSPQ